MTTAADQLITRARLEFERTGVISTDTYSALTEAGLGVEALVDEFTYHFEPED